MKAADRVVLWMILVTICIHMGFSSIYQDWAEDHVVVCHSTSEDSTPYDCNYDGDTDSWIRR